MDDSDSDDYEERLESFYDLIYRTPELAEVLAKLREDLALHAWKKDLRCLKHISHKNIDSLLDPDVVD